MSHTIGRWDLNVGQWIKFSTTEDTNTLTKGQKDIYQGERIFLVVSRTDNMMDRCHCDLIDENGQSLDYCPRMDMLGYQDLLWGQKSTITAFSHAEVVSTYGKEKIMPLYQAAKDMLEKRSSYFDKHAPNAKKLNVDSILGNQSAAAESAAAAPNTNTK